MTRYLDQIPFPEPEFVDNPEPRCPCVLLLDTSGSMKDERQVAVWTALSPIQRLMNDSVATRTARPIDELNSGLAQFRGELLSDELAVKRIELAMITFGPVKQVTDFQPPDLFRPPALRAEGDTPMGQAIERAIQLINDRKAAYKQNGISYYRPWIFLVTDGEPTDHWQRAAELIRLGEASKQFAFFAIGVEGAKFDVLQQLSVRQPLQLKGLSFREMFRWLSASLSAVSRSQTSDEIALVNPATPDGWAAL